MPGIRGEDYVAASQSPTGSAAPGAQRVILHAVGVVGVGSRCTVSVEMRRADDQAVAVAESVFAPAVARRLIAETALRALTSLEPAAEEVAVDAVNVGLVGAQPVVTVTLIHAVRQREEAFVGAAIVGPSGEYEAVARAVLDGTNRRVGYLD